MGSTGGRVCAAGAVGASPSVPLPSQREILVACYDTQRGGRLWLRRVPLDPRRSFLGVRIDVSERAVVVSVNSLALFARANLVLRFDAKDGSGARPYGVTGSLVRS